MDYADLASCAKIACLVQQVASECLALQEKTPSNANTNSSNRKVWQKPDGSPVCNADMLSHEIIKGRLALLLPDVPVVSEEDDPKTEALHIAKHCDPNSKFFLLDPIDGTRSFLAGGNDFCVNLALIDKGEPVFGVISAPTRGYTIMGGTGLNKAYKFADEDAAEIASASATQLQEILPQIHCAASAPSAGITITDSMWSRQKELAEISAELGTPIEKITKVGSALKLLEIAIGTAHLYSRATAVRAWDLAAGHAIVLSAGGDLITKSETGFVRHQYLPRATHDSTHPSAHPPTHPWATLPFHCGPSWLLKKLFAYRG